MLWHLDVVQHPDVGLFWRNWASDSASRMARPEVDVNEGKYILHTLSGRLTVNEPACWTRFCFPRWDLFGTSPGLNGSTSSLGFAESARQLSQEVLATSRHPDLSRRNHHDWELPVSARHRDQEFAPCPE